MTQIKVLFDSLPIAIVRTCFAIYICDNGDEFAQFPSIETNDQGEPYCRTFFTNPYRATDKAHCERNHEFIRYVIPKGKSLNNLSQDQIDTLFSHNNSYVRKSLQNKTPYDVFAKSFGADTLLKLGLRRIPSNLVNLTPTLFK